MNQIERKLFYTLIGGKIKSARNKANLNQSELAEEAGISRLTLANIESGKQKPSIHIIWDIGESLGLNPQNLIPDLNEIRDISNSDYFTGVNDYLKKNNKSDTIESVEILNFLKYSISE